MKNNEFITDIERLKREETWQPMGSEERYTISMRDFFKMPDIDFTQVALEDRDIWVLFN